MSAIELYHITEITSFPFAALLHSHPLWVLHALFLVSGYLLLPSSPCLPKKKNRRLHYSHSFSLFPSPFFFFPSLTSTFDVK